jgi:hypothetical protein
MKTNLTASDVRGHEHSILCLIEDASLDVLPVGRGWTVSAPDADGFVLGDGPTRDAAVLAALPVALAEGYVDRRDIDALLHSSIGDDTIMCWYCDGTGTGSDGRSNCPRCSGRGYAVRS